jgi:hypothetical protein
MMINKSGIMAVAPGSARQQVEIVNNVGQLAKSLWKGVWGRTFLQKGSPPEIVAEKKRIDARIFYIVSPGF